MNTRNKTLLITLALIAMTLAPITPVGAAPIVTEVSPTSGSTNGGTAVTLTGTGFVAGATVEVDGKLAYGINVASGTSITFKTPPGTGSNLAIRVTNPGGQSSLFNNAFTYQAPAVALDITNVSPGSGPANGGTTVTITGEGIHTDPKPTVTFGGTPAIVTAATSTSLTVITPPRAAASANVDIVVTNRIGGDSATLDASFLYIRNENTKPTITGVNPNQGTENGGTTVTITGTNFAPGAKVLFDDGVEVEAAKVTYNSATQLTVVTPQIDAASTAVYVENPNGLRNDSPGTFVFTAVTNPPTISTISPTSGPDFGGTLVTITGTHFHPNIEATVGGVDVDVEFVSSSTLRVRTPSEADATGSDIVVTNPNGVGATSTAFAYESTVRIDSVFPSARPTVNPASVVIIGSGLDDDARVFFGNVEAHDIVPFNAATHGCDALDCLEVTPPAQAAGAINIRVINPDGTAARINGGFSYTSSPNPTINDGHGAGPAGLSVGGTDGTAVGSNGGETLTIRGTGFHVPADDDDPQPTIRIGSVTLSDDDIIAITSTAITVVVPPRASTSAGAFANVLVQVTNPDGKSTATQSCGSATPAPNRCLRYVGDAQPTIAGDPAGLDVKEVGSNGGVLLTITGTDFDDGASVRFGSLTIPAEDVDFTDPTTIAVTIPPRTDTTSAANVLVQVVNPDGKMSATASCGTTDPAPDRCIRYTPASTPGFVDLDSDGFSAIGGNWVLVEGTGFSLDATAGAPPYSGADGIAPAVQLGGVTVPSEFVFVLAPGDDANEITQPVPGPVKPGIGVLECPAGTENCIVFVTPGGSPGAKTLRITNPDGKFVEAGGIFSYASGTSSPEIASVAAETGPTIGGTVVTLTGTGFAATSSTGPTVSIGGTSVPKDDITVNSATEIEITIPARSPGFATIVVTNPDGQAAVLGNTFRYLGEIPQVSSLSSTTGSENGGAAITLTGVNLGLTNPSVVFDPAGTPTLARLTSTSATSIVAVIPTHDPGQVNVLVADRDGQTATLRNAYTFTEATVPTFTSISQGTGSVNGGTEVTITGQNFANGATVTFTDCRGATEDRDATGVSASSDGKTLTFVTPSCLLGPKDLVITNPNGDDLSEAELGFPLTFGFTGVVGPTLNSVNPTAGTTAGGTGITLSGANFAEGATVTVGGTAATNVVRVSATQITATTPAGTAGAANVRVTNPDGQSTVLPGGFTYTEGPAPTLTAVNPDEGTSNGGTSVTLTGTNFVSGATVKFGDNDATNVVFVSATSLTATTPAGTVGEVAVTVRNPDGQEVALDGGFTYLQAPAPTLTTVDPTSGTSNGGTSVTLTGTNFASGATVSFGGTAATNVSVNAAGTEITATTPGHAAGVVDVVVTNPDGQDATLDDGFEFEAAPAPTAAGISPTSGPTAGGTSVTITGTNFATGATVRIGGTAATSVTVNEAGTQITATTPAGTAGAKDVLVRNPDGQEATLTGAFTYVADGVSVTPQQIRDANQAVQNTVRSERVSNGVAVTWSTSAVPADAEGVSVWRINSPAVWVADVDAGTTAFSAGRFVDTDGNDESKYLVTVFFGRTVALGYSTSAITDLPGYQGLSADEVEALASSVDDDGSIWTAWWFWLLLLLGALVLVGMIVLAVVMTRRSGEEGAETDWDSESDLGWADEEGLPASGETGEGGWDDAAAAPAGGDVHHMECPQCGDQFSAVGEKPLVTTCPGCGARGVLR